ncbi:uncharacterized protein LAESUDRAFT_729202 [Laetiporus sulphureus 93-53]|uniref:Uncharacterized protein n=1 Tax=Laetiporus sulphureus 93-53 TaxID=1314785 RepID=A0A165CT09_9APHY|nr:uncharacterized protein LAESUDRAFT_729202 [Laetiporus sulphureus 93-53]KZT03386.1 hypothetical protein LAESUDRAFT_729202 [Laetiporus sulphureus 93-53]
MDRLSHSPRIPLLSFCPECRSEGYPLEYAGTDLATVDRPYESVFLGTGVAKIDSAKWLAYPNQDHHETIELVNSDGILITRNQLARRIAWMYHAYIMVRRI